MRRQFEVAINHLGRRLLHDGAAVQQVANGHQNIIDEHRVIRTEQQVARGQVLAERAGPDADRRDAGALVAEPADAREPAIRGGEAIAGRQFFYRHLAADVRMRVPGAKQATVTFAPAATLVTSKSLAAVKVPGRSSVATWPPVRSSVRTPLTKLDPVAVSPARSIVSPGA